MAPTSARPQISFDDEFFASVAALEPSDNRRVMVAVDQFRKDPNHPSLRLKPLHGHEASRLHSIRAAQHLRILLAREGNVFVFYEAGDRKDIYERAARKRFVVNPERGFAGLIHTPDPDLASLPEPPKPRAPELSEGPKVFDHWGDKDLQEAGFDSDEIAALRSCNTEDDLCTLAWDEDSWSLAIDLLEQTPEQWRNPPMDPAEEAERRVRESIAQFGAVSGISPLFTPDEVAEIAAAPIEDWMIFLHPDQRAIVERSFEGPARIRGAAGTGKTVVALHRAAALAQRFRDEEPGTKILFTTFIKTLPPVFEQLYLRMPGTRKGEVEFVHIDRLAGQVCRDAGNRLTTVPELINAAFATAFRHVVTSGTPLEKACLSRGYLQDEVVKVIKGRGLTELDDYLAIERTGRRMPFNEAMRRQTWSLKEQWQQEMASRDTVDFADVLLQARDHARQRTTPAYRAAIVDEAQDLTLVGLQLIRALVTDRAGGTRRDELLIVGDGAQRIYAGGFTLRQAGVEVRGRTSVLRANYRNTTEILAAAMAVAGDQDVEDLDEAYKRGDEEAEAGRDGARPVLAICDGTPDQLAFIADQVKGLVDEGALDFGDIGVFVPTNRQVDEYTHGLAQVGVPTTGLDKYDGHPTPQVKVGTYFRAKGLEFKVVFLPELTEGKFPRPQTAGQDDAEYAEARALGISQLFVAMTRARDGLFLLCDTAPSDVVAAVPQDRFVTIGE